MTTIAPRGFNLKEWLESPYISPNGSTSHGTITPIPAQIQCYALPYGLIGFISHLLTYLTMYLLSRGRDPLLPWRFLRYKVYNLILSSLGLIITIVLTILTMVRCRNGWQLLLVATWKLTFSLTLSIMALHAATLIDWGRIKRINGAIRRTREGVTISDSRKNGSKIGIITMPMGGNESRAGLIHEKDKVTGLFSKIMVWSPLLAVGGVVGFIGIASLVKGSIGHNTELKIITYVFAAAAGVVTVATMICAMVVYPDQRCLVSNIFGSFLFGGMCCLVVLTVLFALYSDWVLGALADDLTGVPSQDVLVFYLIYFLAKRLPMFSM
ncbi:hypothetical protein QBC37DRAFT_313340 [Rhypophila decipiens]|uniref:Uncharacterized protein n=1 Tax=Rhypophila decipiens TaxID=261697 RepID=A0AAN7B8N5_9PEZI|nr:hypothetical protein QBC37DRAFT_313340 [Rhypophila decipiens]